MLRIDTGLRRQRGYRRDEVAFTGCQCPLRQFATFTPLTFVLR